MGAVIGMVLNRPFFETLGIPRVFVFLPLLCFVTSVALTFVFPNSKQWKVAASINAIPFILLLLLATLFWIVGYHG